MRVCECMRTAHSFFLPRRFFMVPVLLRFFVPSRAIVCLLFGARDGYYAGGGRPLMFFSLSVSLRPGDGHVRLGNAAHSFPCVCVCERTRTSPPPHLPLSPREGQKNGMEVHTQAAKHGGEGGGVLSLSLVP